MPTRLGVESQRTGQFESRYLPLFFGGADKPPYTSDEVGILMLTAFGISLTAGIIDLIIGIVTSTREQTINDLFRI